MNEPEIENARAEVAKGGVYFECKGCGAEGVIKHDNPVAHAARKQTGVQPPNPIVVEFPQCLICSAEPEALGENPKPNTNTDERNDHSDAVG